MTASSDRQSVEAMAESFAPTERETFETAERAHRWATTPTSLLVNGVTGDVISPAGIFSDEEITDLERQHAASVSRYRAKFGERAPEGR